MVMKKIVGSLQLKDYRDSFVYSIHYNMIIKNKKGKNA